MKKKIDIVDWTYENEPITDIGSMPNDVIGFVYRITFTDGRQYIGKKNLWSVKTMKPLKDGGKREGTIDVIAKNTGKGFRQFFHKVKSESDWKTYKGSSEECKDRTPEAREILEYAYTPFELTYLEAKYLFSWNAIENPKYLNDNILGSFYRSSLDAYIRRKEEDYDSFEGNQT